MRKQMESLIAEMLDGRILLDEAITEFEKIYIQTALARNSEHLCNTATALGIHRNTLSKRVASYNGKPTAKVKPSAKKKIGAKKKTSATKKRKRS
jgi:DNA-binding NtrC family response regulator